MGVPEGKSLAGWQRQVEEGISETLEYQYTYRIDNWTWPLKVIWLDQFEDETGEEVCTTFPITGVVHLLDDTEALIDSRWYTEVMTAGNAWRRMIGMIRRGRGASRRRARGIREDKRYYWSSREAPAQ